jgi:hypothetical protein
MISIRINRAELEMIIADLKPLVWVARGNVRNRKSLQDFPDLDFPVPMPKTSNPSDERLFELWTRLDQLSAGVQQLRYRVALDVFEVALCIAGLRATMRTKGQPRLRSSVGNIGTAKERREGLLNKLENYHKQLQRGFETELHNPAQAAESLAEFDRYRRTLVQDLFRHPVLTSGRQSFRRELFLTLVEIAREGLQKTNTEVPPEKELRKLVVMWLRNGFVAFIKTKSAPTTGKTKAPVSSGRSPHQIVTSIIPEVP